jgi:spore coat protein U-like protein
MRSSWQRLLFTLLLILLLPAARAAITCTSVTAPSVAISYTSNTTTSLQSYFTVSCTRTSTSDATSVSYDVFADNGLNPTGQNNRATLGAATVRYDVYTSSSCGTQWKGNKTMSDTITWSASSTGTITKQTSYWTCIVTAQTPTSSGTYTDTIGLTLTYGNNVNVYGTLGVSIYAPALCTMTTAAGDLVLNYTAFGAQVSKSTTFAVTCTNGMPYTISTDVTEGVLTGLRYVLSLSASSATGSGAAQSYSITATLPSGQAGTCAGGNCTGTRTHTLTIAY